MAKMATGLGIEVVHADFKSGLPFNNNSLDLVIFASNDFGYVMSPVYGWG